MKNQTTLQKINWTAMLSILGVFRLIFGVLHPLIIIAQSSANFYKIIRDCITKINNYQIGGFNLNIPRAFFLLISLFFYNVIKWPLAIKPLIMSGMIGNVFSLSFKDDPSLKNLSSYHFILSFALYAAGTLILPIHQPAWLLQILSFAIADIPKGLFAQSLKLAILLTVCSVFFTSMSNKSKLIKSFEGSIKNKISQYKFILSTYNRLSLLCLLMTFTTQFKLVLIFILLLKNRFLFPWLDKARQIDLHPKISLINRQTTFHLEYPPPEHISDLNSKSSSILVNLNHLNSDEFCLTWTKNMQQDYTRILRASLKHFWNTKDSLRTTPTLEAARVYQYLHKKSPENKNFASTLSLNERSTPEELLSTVNQAVLLDGLRYVIDNSSTLMLSKTEKKILQEANVILEDHSYDKETQNIKEEITKIFTLLIALSLLPKEAPEKNLLIKIFQRMQWICAPHIISQFQETLSEKPSLERYLLKYLKNTHLTVSREQKASATFQADSNTREANYLSEKVSIFFDFLYKYKIAESSTSRDFIENILLQLMLPLKLVKYEDFHRDAYEQNISCFPFQLLGAQHELSPEAQAKLKHSKKFLRADLLFLSPQDKATLIAFSSHALASHIYEDYIFTHQSEIEAIKDSKYKSLQDDQLKRFLSVAELLQVLLKIDHHNSHLEELSYDEFLIVYNDWKKKSNTRHSLEKNFKELAIKSILLTMLQKRLLFYVPISYKASSRPDYLMKSIDNYENQLISQQAVLLNPSSSDSDKWDLPKKISTLLFMCLLDQIQIPQSVLSHSSIQPK